MLYLWMQILQIILVCPCCSSINIVKNGLKSYSSKQNYLCKDCFRQFILEDERSYNGTKRGIDEKIKKMIVRGCGVRDIVDIESISIGKVLFVISELDIKFSPKQQHYNCLEIDEFWTYVGEKGNKKWLIYAYARDSKEIVA